ncbi:hypothetical protein F5Y11DRAFT_364365 [Daldinia sp. FL1419]|nr:hypothetical protein F5Y11DRAFT_364365 [Daldinia sp. FL1419]
MSFQTHGLAVTPHFDQGLGENHEMRAVLHDTRVGRLMAAHGNVWNLGIEGLIPLALSDPGGAWPPAGPFNAGPSQGGSSQAGGSGSNSGDQQPVGQGGGDGGSGGSGGSGSGGGAGGAGGPPGPPGPLNGGGGGPPIVTVTSDTVSLYGQIRQMLHTGRDENGNLVRILLTCPICSKYLNYGDLPYPAPRFEMGYPDAVTMETLPCGHMLCFWCMVKWRDHCEEENRYTTCPVCRFELWDPDRECGHHNIVTHLYDAGAPFPPLTLPEGGSIAPNCSTCRFIGLLRKLSSGTVKKGGKQPELGGW